MTCEFQGFTRSDGTQTLRISIPVANPNAAPIRIERLVYSIRAGMRTLAEGQSIRGDTLAPNGHAVLHVEHDAPGWPYVLAEWTRADTCRLEGRIQASDDLPGGAVGPARREDFFFECVALPR